MYQLSNKGNISCRSRKVEKMITNKRIKTLKIDKTINGNLHRLFSLVNHVVFDLNVANFIYWLVAYASRSLQKQYTVSLSVGHLKDLDIVYCNL